VRCAFFAIIVGEVFMVGMDLVDGRDAYRAFGHRDLLLDRVKLGLEELHDADLVFGDVRRPNIMMFKGGGEGEGGWRAELVDFDWTCRHSEVPTDAEYFGGGATPSAQSICGRNQEAPWYRYVRNLMCGADK
jgi:hypothetical protein